MNKIKQIIIKGLLKEYNVNWDLQEDVNILVGINGSGKTTILKSIDALLSKNYVFLKHLDIEMNLALSDHTLLSYPLIRTAKDSPMQINYKYITTFDIPLKDKKTIRQNETPLDKELQRVLYTIGKRQPSFSNYRLKATNFPEAADKINREIERLFHLIDKLFSETGGKIEIDRENNSLVFRKEKSIIPLERLSSGEKQLLIILFTVFLMEEEPAILLMDEPEISLHIGWQQQLIDVIRDLNPNCQLIIATHSPSIFGNGWGDKLFFVEDLIQ
jgi:predicted ATP-binding protein involved in virulence